MRLRIAMTVAAVALSVLIAQCVHRTAAPAPAPAVTSIAPAPAPSPVPFTGPLPAYP